MPDLQPINQSANQPINRSTIQPINQSTNHLITYTLHLADNALILAQRNAEWTGHGPVLEQDIAISNIALDLVGQARNFYQYAAVLINHSADHPVNQPVTEDTLAYLRNANDFRNCLLVELPKGDWAVTVLRQFFFSTWQYYFFQQLIPGKDKTLSAIAEKSLKEVTYHLRWSAEWVVRLGDGTAESNQRINKALIDLWPYTEELTSNASYETALLQVGIAVDAGSLKESWNNKINEVFTTAALQPPQNQPLHTGGKEGKHTGQLSLVLEEMQYLQRTYPNSNW